ncbi:MAG: hypothetical protein WDW38_004485 [Sanguina aurantia]
MHTSTFLSMGPPDVILHFDDCDLAAHAEVLKVYSSVLRDVVRGTLCNLNGNADSEEFLPSIIPMGAGDSLAWGQSLTALYSFVEDVPEGVLWSNILAHTKTSEKWPVVRVESGTLEELILLVNSVTSPTAFDLCGREVRCSTIHTEEYLFNITASDVAIRNGTILMLAASSPVNMTSLCVRGRGDLTKNSGSSVFVDAGGGLALTDCLVDGEAEPSQAQHINKYKQLITKEQNQAAVEMYLLADKYNMPRLAKFARNSLQLSLTRSTALFWKTYSPTEVLDPWQIAAHALQCNDTGLVSFCMGLVVAPLREGRDMLAFQSAQPTAPALTVVLMEKVNKVAKALAANKRAFVHPRQGRHGPGGHHGAPNPAWG